MSRPLRQDASVDDAGPRFSTLDAVRSADTSPAARAVQISVYRRLSPAERVALALSMSEDVRAIAAAGADSRRATGDGASVSPA